MATGSIFFSSSCGTSGASGVRVSSGTATAAAVSVSGVRVSSGIILSVMFSVPFCMINCVFRLSYSSSVMPPSVSCGG